MEKKWRAPCRTIDSFNFLSVLGEGTYGTVYMCRDTEKNMICALKKIRLYEQKEGIPRTALREINLLQRIKHNNIVDLLEVVTGSLKNKDKKVEANTVEDNSVLKTISHKIDYIYLVFEYCKHDLANLMDKLQRSLRTSEIKYVLKSVLCALHFLHQNFIIHRDVKLANLLINSKSEIKLADFGLAREFGDPYTPKTSSVVTLWYRAPELLFGSDSYSEKIDIWATGCIFGELILGRPLFAGKSPAHQVFLICELLGDPSLKIWSDLVNLPNVNKFKLSGNKYNHLKVKFPNESENSLDLINRMLTFDPKKRISAREALVHPYFSEKPPVTSIIFSNNFPDFHLNKFETSKKRLSCSQDEEGLSYRSRILSNSKKIKRRNFAFD